MDVHTPQGAAVSPISRALSASSGWHWGWVLAGRPSRASFGATLYTVLFGSKWVDILYSAFPTTCHRPLKHLERMRLFSTLCPQEFCLG